MSNKHKMKVGDRVVAKRRGSLPGVITHIYGGSAPYGGLYEVRFDHRKTVRNGRGDYAYGDELEPMQTFCVWR